MRVPTEVPATVAAKGDEAKKAGSNPTMLLLLLLLLPLVVGGKSISVSMGSGKVRGVAALVITDAVVVVGPVFNTIECRPSY